MGERTERRLRDEYMTALRAYLAAGDEAALQRGYELGRGAIADGCGVLDLIRVHQEALDTVLMETREAAASRQAAAQAGRFLSESLSSFEMTHRGFQEAVGVLRRLNEMLEGEARRIAHALHDDAAQLLVSAHLALERLADDLPARARPRLNDVRGHLDEMEKQLRRLSHELRPTLLDDLGLLPALEFLAQGMAARSGIAIDVQGPERPRLPAPLETALYRVVQEALRNAAKHAGARRVAITVGLEPGRARCAVRDDGRGFDVAAALGRKGDRGLGLIGMRERLNALGGELTIDSIPGRGTELRITIPMETRDADASPSR